MAIMRKFSRLATLVNRKRQNLFLFFIPFTYLTKRNSRLWSFMILSNDCVESISSRSPNLQLSHCTGPVFHHFVVWVRNFVLAPQKEKRREKKPTFLHPATTRLRGTRSNYRSYIPSFFPPTFSCSLCYDHRERDGEVVYFSARSRGWRGWRRLPFAGQFAILNHRLSGWYPLSSYSMFALSCAMSSLCPFHACLLFLINPPHDKQIFSNAKIDTTTYRRWYVIAVEGGRVIKNCTVLLLSRLYTTSEEYFRTREYNGRYCLNWTQMYVCSFWLFNVCHIAL